MRTDPLTENAVGLISKFSSRKYWSLWNLWNWETEKRCHANVNHRAQSTISLCAGSLLFSLLLFVLCTLDPSRQPWLSDSPLPPVEKDSSRGISSLEELAFESRRRTAALRGMGTMYRRGTKAMNELVVAHVSESTSVEDFRLFLRTLHRSGVTARADLCLLFPWSPPPARLIDVINEEEVFFQKLLLVNSSSNSTISPFNLNAFRKAAEVSNSDSVQPSLWGWRRGENISQSALSVENAGWGSVVGFEVAELNPDDTLRGFIDQAPLQLRRWACYQLILGIVRHKFKHLLLVEVSGVLVLRDPLALVRKKGGLYLSLEDRTWGAVSAENKNVTMGGSREGENASDRLGYRQLAGDSEKMNKRKRSSRGHVAGICEKVYGKELWGSLEEVEKNKRLINSGCLLGGIHQIRGLANAMVVEIVKVALERKSRLPFLDNVVLSYLLHKSRSVLGKSVVEHVQVVENEDSFVHSLIGSTQSSLFFRKGSRAYAIIHGYNKSSSRRRWRDVGSLMDREICSSTGASAVYSDCSNGGTRIRGRLENVIIK